MMAAEDAFLLDTTDLDADTAFAAALRFVTSRAGDPPVPAQRRPGR